MARLQQHERKLKKQTKQIWCWGWRRRRIRGEAKKISRRRHAKQAKKKRKLNAEWEKHARKKDETGNKENSKWIRTATATTTESTASRSLRSVSVVESGSTQPKLVLCSHPSVSFCYCFIFAFASQCNQSSSSSKSTQSTTEQLLRAEIERDERDDKAKHKKTKSKWMQCIWALLHCNNQEFALVMGP